MNTADNGSPALSVTGVTKAHATRAVKWLRHRSYLGFYRKADKSLNMFATKHGNDHAYKAMNDALEATR